MLIIIIIIIMLLATPDLHTSNKIH